MTEQQKFGDFAHDTEKMRDFRELSRIDFMNSYSYLTEQEYDLTLEKVGGAIAPSRNYNLNRPINNHTFDFERKLQKLCTKYGVNCDTETFGYKTYNYTLPCPCLWFSDDYGTVEALSRSEAQAMAEKEIVERLRKINEKLAGLAQFDFNSGSIEITEVK